VLVHDLTVLPKLGVGILYNPSLPEFVQTGRDTFDYVEIIPDMFWITSKEQEEIRYTELETWVDVLEQVRQVRPIVCHSIGFSLGSAEIHSSKYAAQIAAWAQRFDFPWISDHLSFVQLPRASGHGHDAGIAVPLPYDVEMLDLVVNKVRNIQEITGRPFLVENNVYFIQYPEQELSEADFLNQLTRKTGCGILLDLHNLYANCRNHRTDPIKFMDEVDLSKVVEIHIAGGSELAGMYADSHSGPCPEAVWDLLENVLPRAPNVSGVTFEFHDSYFPVLKAEGIRRELGRARQLWLKQH
jgi:uncharacterized protein